MPLRLARIGVPLVQTASEGLAAAGLSPVLLARPEPAPAHQPEPKCVAAVQVPELPTVTQPLAEGIRAAEVESPTNPMNAAPVEPEETDKPALLDLDRAGRGFVTQYGHVPSAEQFAVPGPGVRSDGPGHRKPSARRPAGAGPRQAADGRGRSRRARGHPRNV